MSRKIIIAVDGYSACGKSTMAKSLAKKLGYVFIDTGAMYRAVTLYLLENNIDINDVAAVKDAIKNIHITFKRNKESKENEIYLNGKNVEHEIRSMEINKRVSQVSTIREVREFLVNQQRKIGRQKGVVMDGRDIGTTVFPDAELKLFITASFEERVKRRYKELKSKGISISKEEIRENLKERDYIDTHRAVSPLTKADDAILIDNTNLSPQEQLEMIHQYARNELAVSE